MIKKHKYFVSFTYTKNGIPNYACFQLDAEKLIKNFDDIETIIELLENKDFENVVIINIQRFPI